MNEIPIQYLIDSLEYNEETGIFTWKNHVPNIRTSGRIAGCKSGRGYWSIKLKNVLFPAHRLAHAYVNKAQPTGYIDHINGDILDNRICNLRCVTASGNSQNQRKATASNFSSGILGASFHKKTKKWQVVITVNGKSKHVGLYKTPEEAHLAYVLAKREYHSTCSI